MTASTNVNETVTHTLCGFCECNCGVNAFVSDGVLQRVRGIPGHPNSNGHICPKGAAAPEVIYHPDRIKSPLRRTKIGFERISWDEALDTIAEQLLDIREKHGAHTLVRCSGSPVNQATRYAFTQLMSSYGSANKTGAGHLCSIPRMTGLNSVYGGRSAPDIRNSACIVVWGSNPSDSHLLCASGGVLGEHNTKLIPEMKQAGAKLIVIDPYRTDLARIADKWLCIEPGTDAALALAMLHVIVKEDLYDKEFVENWTAGFDQLKSHVNQYTPQWAANITGVDADDIIEVARVYASAESSCIKDGNAIDMQINAVQTMRAIAMLPALTGNIDVPGGDVFLARSPSTALVRPRRGIRRLSADDYPIFPATPFPSIADAVYAERPYKPQAMFVYHANPAIINANSTKIRQALEQMQFIVVCDIFRTATTELADIVLPDCTDYETWGVRFKSSPMGGVVSLQQKVIEPPDECRPIFEVEYELARRMGLADEYPWKTTEETVNHQLKACGLTIDDLKKQPWIYTSPPMQYRKYLADGFNTPSKKVELYSERYEELGYDPMPVYVEPADTGTGNKYPLIGSTRRPGSYTHTQFRNILSLRKLEPDPCLRISPRDAEMRGIVEGVPVRVESARGIIMVKAKITDEIKPGMVIIDFGWGNPPDEASNVNLLTSDGVRDPISGSTPNRRFRCEVAAINDM